MKYLVEIRIVTMLIVFGFYACDDPERTNPNDPNYEISPPTNLVAQAISDESIQLTWQDNESHELGFKIECDAGSGYEEIGMVGPNVTEYTDTGLTYGQSYGYRVAAYTSVNTSNWASITAATEFPAPSDLSATSVSDSEIALSWRDNTDYENGFRIERDGGSGFVQVAEVDVNVTEFSDTGLTYGQSYGYRVAAYTSINTSDYSATASAFAIAPMVVVDYDGNVYETVTIGDQVWMSENLKVTHYRDGTAITNVTDAAAWGALTTEAYCIYNNNASGEVDTYGALYNWCAVNDSRNIAPEGWHVPTDADWKELEMFLGMSQSEADATGYRGTNEGSKLAGNAGLWTDGSLENNSGFGTSGFTALPGGYRDYSPGYFYGMGNYGYFWSATESHSYDAWHRILYYNNSDVYRGANFYKRNGFSVRLLRD